jgi:hypothetical protein
MMRNGTIYQLPQLVRVTVATDYLLYPTPTASDATTGAIIGKKDKFYQTKGLPRKINQNGKDGSVGLGRLVKIWPKMVSGELNPPWVEWLMGFPLGWTELNALATQSYLNVRKSSRKQSKHTKG